MASHLSDLSSSVKLRYLKVGCRYLVDHFFTILMIPVMVAVIVDLVNRDPQDLLALWHALNNRPTTILCSSLFAVCFATAYFMSRPRTVFLLDFACFKPPETCRSPFSTFIEHCHLYSEHSQGLNPSQFFEKKSIDFMMKILERSGLGEETCLPPAMHYIPLNTNTEAARGEAELSIFSAIDEAFEKTGVKPKDVDVLVVNCSLFSPTPSLASMVINKYKMRSNVRSFNLSGMGCSAGLISLDLAKDLLRVHPNSYALVVSTEIITPNWYAGNQRSMLLPNCLFRMGGSAVLLTNRRAESRRAKYRLLHVVRTHKGTEDSAYRCVYQEEDDAGKVGIALSKDLMITAGNALKSNITTIGPLVLPVSQQLRFLFNMIGRKVFNRKWKAYIPDFKQAFEHFCVHAGGKAVIDELEKNLQLLPTDMEASRMTLHRFGNTSSSSLWYELSYVEAKGRMKKGDRVWQIAFGSGFKCNSAVWRCNRTIEPGPESDGPWRGCIDRYPVHIPDLHKFN